MKKTKRIVALLLAAVLAVGCLGFAAYAADGADLPTVVFDAQTKEFRFEPCGKEKPYWMPCRALPCRCWERP